MYTPEKERKRTLEIVVLNRNVSLFPAVYVNVSGAMLVFGGVNWFVSLQDEQVM